MCQGKASGTIQLLVYTVSLWEVHVRCSLATCDEPIQTDLGLQTLKMHEIFL